MRYYEDARLIDQVIHKNPHALKKLLHKYERIVYVFVMRQVNDKDAVKEIVQDVFIDFLHGLRNFRKDSSIKTYLLTISRNKVIDYIRKKKVRSAIFSKTPLFMLDEIKSFVLDDELDRNQLAEQISYIMKKLPNDYQVVLRLKYIENRKLHEITKIVELKNKATESLLFRARKAFIRLYKKEFEI